MLEPMRISGSFTQVQKEVQYDLDGNHLVNSAGEPFTGAQVTFQYARATVRIEQNVSSLGLSTFSSMINTVNQYPLWNCPARTVRLTNVPWERKVWQACYFFYVRTFEFEVDLYNKDADGMQIGFDHDIIDSGNLCLRGRWDVDSESSTYDTYVLAPGVPSALYRGYPINPGDLIPYKNKDGDHSRVMLDGYGRPASARVTPNGGGTITTDPPAHYVVQYYRESDFLQLGIPSSF
jgi:hypothetical protein